MPNLVAIGQWLEIVGMKFGSGAALPLLYMVDLTIKSFPGLSKHAMVFHVR